jgi:hypothetical protein
MKIFPSPITFFEITDLSWGWEHEATISFEAITLYPITTASNNFDYLIPSEQDWPEVAGDIFSRSVEILITLRFIAVPILSLLHDGLRGAVSFENAYEGVT